MAQVVLSGEPALVSLAVMLLEVVLEHNGPALASLYHTGLFFFTLAYCGSNLVEIGRLFKVLSSCLPPALLSCPPMFGSAATRHAPKVPPFSIVQCVSHPVTTHRCLTLS